MKEQQRIDKALDIITQYGGIDGAHHKTWTLDQVVRALCGVPDEVVSAIDAYQKPYTYKAQGTNQTYLDWVTEYNDGDEGPNTYQWDEGIPP